MQVLLTGLTLQCHELKASVLVSFAEESDHAGTQPALAVE